MASQASQASLAKSGFPPPPKWSDMKTLDQKIVWFITRGIRPLFSKTGNALSTTSQWAFDVITSDTFTKAANFIFRKVIWNVVDFIFRKVIWNVVLYIPRKVIHCLWRGLKTGASTLDNRVLKPLFKNIFSPLIRKIWKLTTKLFNVLWSHTLGSEYVARLINKMINSFSRNSTHNTNTGHSTSSRHFSNTLVGRALTWVAKNLIKQPLKLGIDHILAPLFRRTFKLLDAAYGGFFGEEEKTQVERSNGIDGENPLLAEATLHA